NSRAMRANRYSHSNAVIGLSNRRAGSEFFPRFFAKLRCSIFPSRLSEYWRRSRILSVISEPSSHPRRGFRRALFASGVCRGAGDGTLRQSGESRREFAESGAEPENAVQEQWAHLPGPERKESLLSSRCWQ